MTVDSAQDGLSILLIEDERSVMDFMCLALERSGYCCTMANSAAERSVE